MKKKGMVLPGDGIGQGRLSRLSQYCRQSARKSESR